MPTAQSRRIARIVSKQRIIILRYFAKSVGVLLDNLRTVMLKPRDAIGVIADLLADGQRTDRLAQVAVAKSDARGTVVPIDIGAVKEFVRMQRFIHAWSTLRTFGAHSL